MHVRFSEQNTGIVREVTGRKIVGPIHDHVVVGKEFEGIARIEPRLHRMDRDVRVQPHESFLCDLHFRPSHIRGRVEDLSLEI